MFYGATLARRVIRFLQLHTAVPSIPKTPDASGMRAIYPETSPVRPGSRPPPDTGSPASGPFNHAVLVLLRSWRRL